MGVTGSALDTNSERIIERAPSRERSLAELQHKSWIAEDGVPGSVFALAQTTDGYLWLGTSNGLYRYDGERFERYEPPAGQRLPSHIVESLLALPDGGLWIGFRDGGAALLKDGKLTVYSEAEGLPFTVLRSFARTRDGKIWAATGRGLFRLEGNHWNRVGKDIFPWTRAQTLFVDRQGTLWAATEDRIVFLPEGGNQFQTTGEHVVSKIFEVNRIVQAPDGTIWIGETSYSVRPIKMQEENSKADVDEIIVGSYGLLFDSVGSLWIASIGGGVGRIRFPEKLRGRGAQKLRDVAEIASQKEGLSSEYAISVLEDREGNIWVGTQTGLDRFQETDVVPVPIPAGSNDMVLIPGDHGDLWTASLNRGLMNIEGRSVTAHPQKETDWATTCGYRDADGSLWLGGPTGIRHYVEGRYIKVALPQDAQGTWAFAIAPGGPGVFWTTISGGGLLRYAKGIWTKFGADQGLPKDLPTNNYTDAAGQVWFGYARNRLALFDGNKFRMFSANDGIATGDVMTIYGHGPHLWIGGEFGLELYRDGRFVTINSADPTHFSGITGIVETENGDLWLNAVNGIVYVAASEVRHALESPDYRMVFREFNYLDGLPGNSAALRARPTAVQASDGKLWFSLANGIVWIDPSHLRKNLLIAPVQVSSVSANGKQYGNPTNVELPIRTTSLEISYAALSFTVPERIRFRYRLDGVDDGWQDAGSRREAFYTRLSPGHHRFHVIACNNDGVWNEAGATLNFNIAPAFYQTGWFKGLNIVAGLCVLYLLYLLRLRQVTRQVRVRMGERFDERERIARDLHDTLLQSVQGLILKFHALARQVPADEVRQAMGQALDHADQVLAEGRDRVRSLRGTDDTLSDLAAAFQRVAKESSPERAADVKVVIEGNVRQLDPMVLEESFSIAREALLNALHHSGGLHVEVEIAYDPKQFRLRVRDDGRGIDPSVLKQGGRPDHWGLPGMRERAQKIGAQLELWSRPDAGTEVELTVPGATAYRPLRPRQRKFWFGRPSRIGD